MNRILTIIFLLLSIQTFSQNGIIWYDPIEVATKYYGNLHPRIVLDQGYKPLVLWGDVNGKAWVAKFNGKNFDDPEQISSGLQPVFTETWAGPEMTAHGDTIYVVYKTTPEEKGHIFVKHSYDGGKTFSIETQVDGEGPLITRFPSVAMDPYGNPLVAYMKMDPDYSNPRYCVGKSTDLGEDFTFDTTVKDFSGGAVSDCCPATIIESGNATVMLYRDNLGDRRNIWAAVSRDGAISFPRGIQTDTTEWITPHCPANPPHGIIIGDTLYTTYSSGDFPVIYLSKTSLSTSGTTSIPLTGHFAGLVSQNFPRIANSGNATALVWEQANFSSNQICLFYTSDITAGLPEKYDTVATGTFGGADVAVGGGHIYLVWEDDFTGKIMCRVGFYQESLVNKLLAENTTIALKPAPNGKFFTVALANISSCIMIDMQGKENEMDIDVTRHSCKVNTEDLEPGLYIVKIYSKDDQVYTYKYEVKEIPEKKERDSDR